MRVVSPIKGSTYVHICFIESSHIKVTYRYIYKLYHRYTNTQYTYNSYLS